MKITCSKDELTRALSLVGRAVSTRASVQVLGGVLLRASGGQLELAATDMELSLRLVVDCEVEGDGAVVAPGRLLVDLARLLPDGEVVLEHKPEQGTLEVTCGSASYKLNTYSAEDFPKLPDAESAQTFTADRAAFLETVSRVARSASRDESRPVLTGILVRFEGGKLVMAATDSYRLSVKETEIAGSEGAELEAIVPARALTELSRIAQDEGDLRIGVQENHVVFGAGETWLTSRRIDGQFPNYKQLLPETFEHEVKLPREEFLEVVRRASVMAQRNSPLAAPVRRGRGDRLGSDPGRRRGERVAPGAVRRRAARDRVQPGVPARRPGVGDERRGRTAADQPAPAGPHPLRRRALLVPDHAHPAGRLNG